MNINSIIIRLTEEYPTQTESIRQIKIILEEIEKEKNVSENVEKIQEICNTLYNIKNTDELIDLQVIINEYRNKYDITDPREIINTDNGKGFVQ